MIPEHIPKKADDDDDDNDNVVPGPRFDARVELAATVGNNFTPYSYWVILTL